MDESLPLAIEFFRAHRRQAGKPLGVSTFTERADAQEGGHAEHAESIGRNMMFSRAMSNGVKWYCPDVFSGNAMYTPEELGASVNGDGEVIETTYTVAQPAPEPAAPAPEHNGNGASPSPL
jgi:hypothetical protein